MLCAVANWLEGISGSADHGREDVSRPEIGAAGSEEEEDGGARDSSELEEGGKRDASGF
jgi:hypothetical protein